jgi:hypothetical protein
MISTDIEDTLQFAMVADAALAGSFNIDFHMVNSLPDKHRAKIISCVSVQSHIDTSGIQAILVTVNVGHLWTVRNKVDTFNIHAVKGFICKEIIDSILESGANSPIDNGHSHTGDDPIGSSASESKQT